MADSIPAASPPRLRFAPSPTGSLHVGGARTALFNWLLARKEGGQFLLRVEDTDRARSTEASTEAIFTGLRWLGLDWDEDVVFQGANLERHRRDADRLLAADAVYRCFCTAEEIEQRRAEAEARGEAFKYDRRCDRLGPDEIARRVADGEAHVLRFRVPEGATSWADVVHGTITFPNKDIEDFIVLRSDRTPIYNMAVVSDDVAMRITHVMRGDDHISNTPKQILIYEALGASVPVFAHLPMIHGTDGKKLSKRRNAVAVGDYQAMGILPEAMRNFLALLGWSPGGDVEVMTLDAMIAHFSTDGLLKKASVFDTQKLEWMNGQHLALMSLERLRDAVATALVTTQRAMPGELEARPEWFDRLLQLLRIRSRTVDELVRQAEVYLVDDIEYDADAVATQWLKDPSATAALLRDVRDTLGALPEWTAEAMETALRATADRRGIGAGKLFQPLRVALVGGTASPGIFDVLELLGRDRALRRVDAAMARVTPAGAA